MSANQLTSSAEQLDDFPGWPPTREVVVGVRADLLPAQGRRLHTVPYVGRRAAEGAAVGGPSARRRGPALVALAAFLGTWLSHTVEYLREGSPGGVIHHLFGSVHLYMGPVGVVLLATASAGGMRWWRLWQRLALRLDRAGACLRRRQYPYVADGDLPASTGARLVSLVSLLFVLQVGFYTLQENLESLLSTRHLPGLAVLTGQHWPVLVIHLTVAIGLGAVVGSAQRRMHDLVRAVAVRERLAWWLEQARRRVVAAAPRAAASRRWTPLDRWGAQRWQRPPPRVRVV